MLYLFNHNHRKVIDMKKSFFFLLISLCFGKTYAMVSIPQIVVEHSESAALISSVTVEIVPDESLAETNKLEDTVEYKTEYPVKDLNRIFCQNFLNGTIKENRWTNNNWQQTFDFCAKLLSKTSGWYFPYTLEIAIRKHFNCNFGKYSKVLYYISDSFLGSKYLEGYYQCVEFLKLFFIIQYFDIKVLVDPILNVAGFYYICDRLKNIIPDINYEATELGEDGRERLLHNLNIFLQHDEGSAFSFHGKQFMNFFNKGLNPRMRDCILKGEGYARHLYEIEYNMLNKTY